MDFRDTLSADLPAPRDDEPGSLRDDILDELADHLACAYRREVMRGADAQAARQRVLEQFGDPAAVARRLWFDAMKGRIMAQRVLVVSCIILTLISLSLAGIMSIQAVQAQRMAAAAQARMAEEMRRAQEAQLKMLEQLQSGSKGAQGPNSPDWNPVIFSLSEEEGPGPPAVGVRAGLGRGNQGSQKQDAIQRESDENGRIDFGVVQPGDWEFSLSRPCDDGGTWRTTGKLNVLPGNAIEMSITCPSSSPQLVPLTVRIDLTPDLADKGMAVLASLGHTGFTYQPPLHWRLTDNNNPPGGAGSLSLLGGPGPKRVQELEGSQYYFWTFAGVQTPATEAAGLKPQGIYVDLPGLDLSREPQPLQALPGTYRLSGLVVVKPLKEHSTSFHGERGQFVAYAGPRLERGQFVAYAGPRLSQHQVYALESAPGDNWGSSGSFGGSLGEPVNPLPGLETFWRNAPTFEAKKGETNQWTINLPDAFIRAVRERLKEELKK
jgi:hypothetical protein